MISSFIIKNKFVAAAIFFAFMYLSAFVGFLSSYEKINVSGVEVVVYKDIDIPLEARSAIIYNIDTDTVLAGKDVDAPYSIASITKLASGLIANKYLSNTDSTTIESEDFKIYANTNIGLGDEWFTRDLLKFSLITSSNRGINAVGRTVHNKTGIKLVDLLNEFAVSNSLVQTHFVNSTGLDAHEGLSGSESSAQDIAKIAAIFVKTYPDLAGFTRNQVEIFTTQNNKTYTANNTNTLLSSTQYPILLTKTGYTDIAGGTLAMVLEIEGERIAFVVLGSSRSGRFTDMKSLIEFYTLQKDL